MAKTQIDRDAAKRRAISNNPGINPEVRWYMQHLNSKLGKATFGTTTTTTSTTTTTTTTTTS